MPHATSPATKKSAKPKPRPLHLQIEVEVVKKPTLAEVAYRPGQDLGLVLDLLADEWKCSRSQAAKELAILGFYQIAAKFRPVVAEMAAGADQRRDAFPRVAHAIFDYFVKHEFTFEQQGLTLEAELKKCQKP